MRTSSSSPTSRTGLVKRVAKYHQYWAVNAAVESTVEAAGPDGDRRGGVVWHTQGSGKSLEMLFYAAKIMRDPRDGNPTLVFITDRNDLDDQLFGEVFAPARDPARDSPCRPTRAPTCAQLLRRRLGRDRVHDHAEVRPEADGDAHPVLTDRRNVVVVADEAHRSQYDFDRRPTLKHLRDALPNATFIGFTGTPIESADQSTRAVFGEYIDVYDLTHAVEDGATVRIYYESRLAKVQLPRRCAERWTTLADEITEVAEEDRGRPGQVAWARLEAIVGAEERLDLVAADIVEHWEKRREALVGKAHDRGMSRRIAVDLYNADRRAAPGLARRRPDARERSRSS